MTDLYFFLIVQHDKKDVQFKVDLATTLSIVRVVHVQLRMYNYVCTITYVHICLASACIKEYNGACVALVLYSNVLWSNNSI